ncbi:hypothetical protein [Rhizobium alvei]|uniref:Conjugal transfer protein TraG n=1 Tax=Rhizobium alvei TaxID=1132659 RepID=A0ABT8YSZ5_9HYPH|nr:hypothetical protein [Rhizobium alvei]MDO6966459.1 hypothetical protein [Rhizobium alvei]
MIRTVGNNGGTPIDPATRHAGKDAVANKIAKAETLGALKIRAGNGEGMPTRMEQSGASFSNFSAQLGLGEAILEGTGAQQTAETLSRLRSEARQQTKTDRDP